MLKNEYIYQEARNNFKGWTKEGLEFLLSFLKCSLVSFKVHKVEIFIPVII